MQFTLLGKCLFNKVTKDAKNISVTSSTIQNNSITGTNMGDENGGGKGVIDTNLSISNTNFTGNVSGNIAGGGGIFFHQLFDHEEAQQIQAELIYFS